MENEHQMSILDDLSSAIRTVHDSAGQALVSIDPLNQRTTTAYDAAGRAIASTNPPVTWPMRVSPAYFLATSTREG